MNVNDLAKMLGDACYGFLAINFIWGLYNIIMGFRRVKELNFSSHDEQADWSSSKNWHAEHLLPPCGGPLWWPVLRSHRAPSPGRS